jgi:hypothetical protein
VLIFSDCYVEKAGKRVCLTAQNIVSKDYLQLDRLNTITGARAGFGKDSSGDTATRCIAYSLAAEFQIPDREIISAIDYFYLDVNYFNDHDYDSRPWLWSVTPQITGFVYPHGFFLATNVLQAQNRCCTQPLIEQSLQFLITYERNMKKVPQLQYSENVNRMFENYALDSIDNAEDEIDSEETAWEEQDYRARSSIYVTDFLNTTIVIYSKFYEEKYLSVCRVTEAIVLYKSCCGLAPVSKWVFKKDRGPKLAKCIEKVKKGWSMGRRWAHENRKTFRD